MVDHIDRGDVARGSVNQGNVVPPVHYCPFTVMVTEYIDSRQFCIVTFCGQKLTGCVVFWHISPCNLFVHRACVQPAYFAMWHSGSDSDTAWT
jgi:hypothetical protein